jgi:hypothetical protein
LPDRCAKCIPRRQLNRTGGSTSAALDVAGADHGGRVRVDGAEVDLEIARQHGKETTLSERIERQIIPADGGRAGACQDLAADAGDALGDLIAHAFQVVVGQIGADAPARADARRLGDVLPGPGQLPERAVPEIVAIVVHVVASFSCRSTSGRPRPQLERESEHSV